MKQSQEKRKTKNTLYKLGWKRNREKRNKKHSLLSQAEEKQRKKKQKYSLQSQVCRKNQLFLKKKRQEKRSKIFSTHCSLFYYKT